MSFNQMTHRQARTLAQFVNSLRGDWDPPGIEDALGRARHLAPASDLAIAAIKAASSASNRTPAVIPLEGAHWRGSEVTPQRKFDPSGVCAVCSQSEAECRRRWHDDHTFLAVDRRRSIPSAPMPDAIREQLTSGRAEPTKGRTMAMSETSGGGTMTLVHQNRRGERDIRPWQPSDGDTRCQRCGRPNIIWYTDHDLWNTVMPEDGVLCVGCFVEAAEQHLGIGVVWYVHHEATPVSSEFSRGLSAGMAITKGER